MDTIASNKCTILNVDDDDDNEIENDLGLVMIGYVGSFTPMMVMAVSTLDQMALSNNDPEARRMCFYVCVCVCEMLTD